MGITGRIAGGFAGIAALLVLGGCGAPAPSQAGEGKSPGTTSGVTAGASAGTTISVTAESLRLEYRATTAPAGELPFPGALVTDAADMAVGKPGGTFTYVAFGDGPKDFNPVTANDSGSNDVNVLRFAPLIGFDNLKQQFVPSLCEEWYQEPNKDSWIVRVRKDVKWSDGQPFTIDDILFTFQCIYDEKIPNPSKDNLKVAGKPFEFEKVDEQTLRVKTAQPTIWLPVMLGVVQPVPKHALEAAYKEGRFDQVLNISMDPKAEVCSGPFMLERYDQGERVVLKKNPNYFKADPKGQRLPYLDSVIMTFAPDQDQMMLRFERGDADGFIRPRQSAVPDLMAKQQQGAYTLFDCGPSDGFNCLWYNLKDGNSPSSGKPYVDPVKQAWFSDRRFRQASILAIDKPSIIRTELRGLAVDVWGIESPSNALWYNPNVKKYEFSREKATALLDEMGLKDTDGDGIREDTKGNKVSFTFITNKGNKVRENIAALISQDLRAVGIDARPQFLDFNALVTATADSFDYEACLLGFGGSIFPTSSMNLLKSSGRTHFWNPSQEKPATEWEAVIDGLCEEFIMAPSVLDAQKVYFRIQEVLGEECAFVPLFTSKVFVAARNKFANLKPTALTPELLWNAEELFLK